MSALLPRIADDENLHAAWRKVRANHGGPGVDAVTLKDFEENLSEHLSELRQALTDDTYLPSGLRRTTIPKKGGGERELRVPTVLDRVAQRAFVNVLEPLFEPLFLPCSFGYRPGRGVDDAIGRVLAYRAAGLDWILDADVADFFPSVDHDLLRGALRRHLSDRGVLRVISLWLDAGALDGPGMARPSLVHATAERLHGAFQALASSDSLEEAADWERSARASSLRQFGSEAARLAWENRHLVLPVLASRAALLTGGAAALVVGGVLAADAVLAKREPRRTGTPQGGPISPLLSNVYLHSFDEGMQRAGLRLVRYADDFVVCCPSAARARQARDVAATELARLRLTLHPQKTRILSCRDPLEFLGHAFDDDGALPIPPTASRPAPIATVRAGGKRLASEVAERVGELRGRKKQP